MGNELVLLFQNCRLLRCRWLGTALKQALINDVTFEKEEGPRTIEFVMRMIIAAISIRRFLIGPVSCMCTAPYHSINWMCGSRCIL